MNLLILDSGHNEYVSGKQAPDGSLREWIFNNSMQYKLKKRAEDHSIKVYLTNPNPEKKNEIGLTKRTELANAYWKNQGKPKTIFASIHANAYGGGFNVARGCETYHASNASTNSKNCAKFVNDEIFNACKSIDDGFKNRGVKSNNFTVIYKAAMPSILIEYGFYTNKGDLAILKNRQDDLCEATIKGLCKYFGITYKAPQIQPTSFLVKINTDTLNVRSGPGTSYGVVTQVKRDEVYTIIEEKNGWGLLKSGVGWISLSYTIKK